MLVLPAKGFALMLAWHAKKHMKACPKSLWTFKIAEMVACFAIEGIAILTFAGMH